MKHIGHHIIQLGETDSTNKEAWRLIEGSYPAHGTVLVADYQHTGKGQAGNSWESERGKNLLMTVILRPESFPASRQFALNMAISAALSETITQCCQGHISQIKWPNDIYVGEKKIAGILIENSILGQHLVCCVAGMGMNINQLVFRSDAPNPVSMVQLTGQAIPITHCLQHVCEVLERWYNTLLSHGFEDIRRVYYDKLLGFRKRMTFRDKSGLFDGMITGVDEFGNLCIECQGETRKYGFKEVEFML